MFLDLLVKHNPALIDYGIYLLEQGLIEPDTYVLDLDSIEKNAHRLQDISKKFKLTLYFMSKQLGRNPEVSRRVLAAGFTGMVAVDFREAMILHSAGIPVKHLGHLCQIPNKFLDAALDMNCDVISIYSFEKAQDLSKAAQRRGIVQDLLLRVRDYGDIFYQGQEGGFPLETLHQSLDSIKKLPNIRIMGLTTFPCFLYQADKRMALPTPNAYTLVKGAIMLKEHGIPCLQINMPSCNSPATMPLAAELGATHLEPGHSLTGTNPDNLDEDEPLSPALLYMSEVSHHVENRSFCFGGGYYRRSNLYNALVKTSRGLEKSKVISPQLDAIDYHLELSGLFPSGSAVCMAFRTQIFVTRSRVALVDGLTHNRPKLLGIWDSQGQALSKGMSNG